MGNINDVSNRQLLRNLTGSSHVAALLADLQEMDRDSMMDIDELIRLIDRDPEVIMTVDNAIKNACSGKVVSLEYYKNLVVQYRGWKPLSMKEYAEKINGSRYLAMKLEMAQQRKDDNEKVKRSHRLHTPPKPKK